MVEEVFTEAAQADFMEAQLHAVRRLLTRRCGPAVCHPSIVRPRERTAVDQFTRGNATRRLECVRHHRSPIGGLMLIRIEVRSRARAHIRWQASRKAIVSRDSRIAEIQLSQMCGPSETPEHSSGMETTSEMQTTSETQITSETQTIFGMETIFGMQTISGMETLSEMGTIIFVVTGKNTFSRSAQGIGIATGTVTVTIGGMVTDAASLMDRG